MRAAQFKVAVPLRPSSQIDSSARKIAEMCCLLSLIRTPFSFNQSERGIVNASGSIFIRPITNAVLHGKLRTALSSVEMNNRLVLKHKLLGKTHTSYRYRWNAEGTSLRKYGAV